MNELYKLCGIPFEQRLKLNLALFKAGREQAEAEYHAFQLVLEAAARQPGQVGAVPCILSWCAGTTWDAVGSSQG
jgi:hypothetical protein